MVIDPWLITPGERLGKLTIGAESTTLDRLGPPTGGDGAMGHFWNSWVGRNGGRLDVYTTRKFPKGGVKDVVTIDVARATSSRFHLPNGIRTGTLAAKLKAVYPSAKRTGSYRSHAGLSTFWDDVRQGLAWEVRGGRVFALIVHAKGDPIDRSIGPYLQNPIPRP